MSLKKLSVLVVSIILVLVLALSFMAGCTKTTPAPAPAPAPAPSPAPAPAPSPAPAPAPSPAPAPAPAPTPTIKPIELKLTHIMSPTSNPQYLYQYLADKINERTKGRVKITVYSSGIINQPAQGLDAVKTGVADIAHHSPNFTIGMQPTAECLSVPVPAQNSWVFNQAAADLASKFQVQGLKEFSDVHFLSFVGPAGPYYLMTTKKLIQTPQDVKGLKMRSAGVMSEMITAWGGSPVAMATAEVYESLNKGVIDGGLLPGEQLTGWKLAEPVKYITIIPTYTYGPSILLMNLNKWNSLPKDIQQVFNDTINDLHDWEGKTWWYSDASGLDYFLSLPGKQLYTIPANEQAQWETSVQPIIDKYVATYAKLGLPTADYVTYLKERCNYWNGKQPDKKSSMDWVKKEILKQ